MPLHCLGQQGGVAAGKHIDLIAQGCQLPSRLGDIHVLAAAVGAATGAQGRCVFADDGNAFGHGVWGCEGVSEVGGCRGHNCAPLWGVDGQG